MNILWFLFSQACIDDLHIIIKGDFSDHLEKINLTLHELRGTKIKCNI